MSSSREGPNPLRPYYIPPSIGISDQPPTTSVPRGLPTRNGTTTTYASSARDMFSDIDYSGYVSDSSRSTLETIRELLDQALYKYVSVLMAQPFEVAKTVLQVRSQAVGDGSIPLVDTEDVQEHPSRYRDSVYDDVTFPVPLWKHLLIIL
jgi:fusion and transport protein UGO1